MASATVPPQLDHEDRGWQFLYHSDVRRLGLDVVMSGHERQGCIF